MEFCPYGVFLFCRAAWQFPSLEPDDECSTPADIDYNTQNISVNYKSSGVYYLFEQTS